MLFVVGGVARAGKSQLATAMHNQYDVPWMSLDALRWGLSRAAPILGIDSENDDREDAERIWPIIEAMAENILFDGRNYLIEGVCLRAEDVAKLIVANPGTVTRCFLGYPDIALAEKIDETMRYDGPNDWLRRLGPDRVASFLEGAIRRSAVLRDECLSQDIPFIDTGSNFQQKIEETVAVLGRYATNRVKTV